MILVYLAIAIGICALVALGPLATIWALNTVFGFSIPFTLWTWLATFWLMLVVAARRTSK